jgi:Zn-dependent protease
MCTDLRELRIGKKRNGVACELQVGNLGGAAITRQSAYRASIFRKGWRLTINISAILRYLIAIVGHELAHILMATALSVRIKRIGLSWAGPYIVRETGSLNQNLAITLSGCVFNIGIAICLMHVWAAAAFVNMVLGVYNLLPIPGSDGKRAWALLKQLVAKRRLTVLSSDDRQARGAPVLLDGKTRKLPDPELEKTA